jgi:ribosome maturation factor RimP
MAQVHDKERTLQKQIAREVEQGLPGTEVLAVELSGPEKFTVYVDHPQGVDHALCERVTNVLRDYLRDYSVEVSSPGLERPLRTPAHFQRVVGRKVAVRTEHEVAGRKRFRGEVTRADDSRVHVRVDKDEYDIPYGEIVRGNLIDEG